MTWLRSHRHHEPEPQPEGDGPASEPELLTPHPNTPGGGAPWSKTHHPGGLEVSTLRMGPGRQGKSLCSSRSLGNGEPGAHAVPVFTSSQLILSVALSQSTGPGWGSRLQSPQALQTQSGGRKWEVGRRNQELGLV